MRLNPEKNGERSAEAGFLLLWLVVATFLLLLALSVAAPRMAKELERDKETESVHRAQQYTRAIQLYYAKAHNYPTSLEQLEKTNNIRFLRKRYVDPLTGGEYRLIPFGQAKTQVKGFFGEPLQGTAAGSLGTLAGSVSDFGNNATPGGAPGQAGSAAGGGFGSAGGGFGSVNGGGNGSAFGSAGSAGGAGSGFGGSSGSFGGNSSGGSGGFGGNSGGFGGGSGGFGESSGGLGGGSGGFGSSPSTSPIGGQAGANPTGFGGAAAGTADAGAPGSTLGGTSATDFKGSTGPFVGVASTAKGSGLVEWNGSANIEDWEFLYDPRVEILRQRVSLFGGAPASPGTGSLGSNSASTFGAPAGSPNGTSPGQGTTATPSGGQPAQGTPPGTSGTGTPTTVGAPVQQ